MNRRKFLTLSALAVAAALASDAPAEVTERRHIYLVDHGGESTWWAAASEEDAKRLHHEHFDQYEDRPGDYDIYRMPEDHELDVETGDGVIVKTCKEWAQESVSYKVPLIATTCY